jgi:UDP-2,4-diacetamido-2,4,6-trideoxy-beta-L-altropyranose hydrolase
MMDMRHKKGCAFRVDAGLEIGSGHIMRCLTLANALAEQGYACHFITRRSTGVFAETIQAQGHSLHYLPEPSVPQGYGPHPAPPAHAAWLSASWQDDAAATAEILTTLAPRWLVLDHYALDAAWEKAALPKGTRLFVLDDLADRPHICDLLLDQTLGREAVDYEGRVPMASRLLIGPSYALLRPEFSQLRAGSLARRTPPELAHILVTLGGVDKHNITGDVLKVLAKATLPAGAHITVVMGGQAPALAAIKAQAAEMPLPTKVLVNIDNMAEVMASADLSIGAAGSTSWERCCLGLPTLMLTIADNQMGLARVLAQNKVAIGVADVRHINWQTGLAQAVQSITPETLARLTAHSYQLVDGAGCARCVQQMARCVQ